MIAIKNVFEVQCNSELKRSDAHSNATQNDYAYTLTTRCENNQSNFEVKKKNTQIEREKNEKKNGANMKRKSAHYYYVH